MFWLVLLALVAIYFLLDRFIRVLKVRDVTNKYVFVTGCDSGFGRDLVINLDKLGHPVFAGCYTEEGRRSLSEACSTRVQTLHIDVTSDDSIQSALTNIRQKLPNDRSLWAVVNNAGIIGQIVAAELCSKQEHQACYDINLIGAIEVSRTFMPLLRKSKGRLVNLTSVMGRCAAEAAPYCVSKFGLEAYSDVVRREVARFGVKVSLIEPGYFQTSLFNIDQLRKGVEEAFNRADPEVQEAYGKKYPQEALASLAGKLARSSPHRYKVVDALTSAITCVYPRARYVVGYDAKFFFIPITIMPAWLGDWLLLARERRIALEN